MNSARAFNLSVVFEFAGEPDHMMHSLLENLRQIVPELKITLIPGVFSKYRPGGLHIRRLINLAWVYLRVPAHLLFSRPDAVIVQSAPPGVQLWTVAWAAIERIPVYCWLMDYHPEFEARALERRGFRGLARPLRTLDASLMPRFAAIITLDPAMTALVRVRAKSALVLEHPTWVADGPARVSRVSYRPGSGGGPLCLAYSGNLGAAHDLTPLRRLFESVASRRPVRLFVIGGSKQGELRFRQLCDELGIPVDFIARVPQFADLRVLYERLKIDAGIVVLSEESAGLVSPSKFSGYINFGLPLVYLGPPGTNAAMVCQRFNGGFWLRSGSGSAEMDIVAGGLLDQRQMAAAATGAHAAAEHFAGFDGRSLAGALAPLLVGRPG